MIALVWGFNGVWIVLKSWWRGLGGGGTARGFVYLNVNLIM